MRPRVLADEAALASGPAGGRAIAINGYAPHMPTFAGQPLPANLAGQPLWASLFQPLSGEPAGNLVVCQGALRASRGLCTGVARRHGLSQQRQQEGLARPDAQVYVQTRFAGWTI